MGAGAGAPGLAWSALHPGTARKGGKMACQGTATGAAILKKVRYRATPRGCAVSSAPPGTWSKSAWCPDPAWQTKCFPAFVSHSSRSCQAGWSSPAGCCRPWAWSVVFAYPALASSAGAVRERLGARNCKSCSKASQKGNALSIFKN